MSADEKLIEHLKQYARDRKTRVEELDAMIASLQEERETEHRRLKNAVAILKDELDNSRKESGSDSSKSTEPAQKDAFSESGLQISGDMPFREILREILRWSGKPMRSTDIRAVLEDAGYKYDLATSLTTRIGNELYRMAQQEDGPVQKDGPHYQYVETEEVS